MSAIVRNDSTDAPAGETRPVRAGGGGLRVIAIVLALAGAALLAFGFWGTHGGAARFGDGFVPIGAGSLGGILIIAGVIADIVAERRHRKATR